MIKRMLIDDTNPEETRVVVINGNKLEDVECETAYRRQIKGNIYLAKVMRVEPSLQAAFVDYGGNKHGFLAFGEIHPDYYNVSEEELAEVDKEVDEIIENKKAAIKERELERERIRAEKQQARLEAERLKAEQEAAAQAEQTKTETEATVSDESDNGDSAMQAENAGKAANEETAAQDTPAEAEEQTTEAAGDVTETTEEVSETAAEASESDEENQEEEKGRKSRYRRRPRRSKKREANEGLKVLSEDSGTEEDCISEAVSPSSAADDEEDDEICGSEAFDEDDEEEQEYDFDLQKKLLKSRKLYHRHNIQEVIKEGQILLVQIVKEERGNKGAALTTYLSLAGRYCVLMPNRIKSGGVSRKITNVADRKRLKNIVRELPLTSDMSIIVRTAGEEKTKADIVRDYNYLIRSWNQIRIASLSSKAPAMIHEEGNLIKRALRDIYTKEVSEILVSGENAYKMAKDFFRILSPHSLKKIKNYRNNEMPLFQRFQVETQLDKLHDANAQLESGGYLVINPTEALVSIDVNSGRATKEKDLEETALKTNLEACDEIARQLRMRNLAGLVVIDFIDMDEPANNHAVERRMKEALKKDRSRVQVGKMSCFGLLELSRQRMHSSFFESNYTTCPYCGGKGLVRTTDSAAVLILRGIEEEGIRNRSASVNVFVPGDIAVYLLNHKREKLIDLEKRYGMSIIISADNSIKNVSDYRIERVKSTKSEEEDKKTTEKEKREEKRDDCRNERRDGKRNSRREKTEEKPEEFSNDNESSDTPAEEIVQVEESDRENTGSRRDRRDRNRRGRRDRNGNRDRKDRTPRDSGSRPVPAVKEKQEAIILYNSRGNTTSLTENKATANSDAAGTEDTKEKTTWWKKLIKG
ncbi:MAG: Rne/Rng family ribonuclease [Alphaproteobacteria bacterium]|nr:Rne/Rng family ribonuclease [Alphaproteobacteria bacterium]